MSQTQFLRIMDYKKIMLEFEEKYNCKDDDDDVESGVCDVVSAKRNRFLGVSKDGNKWRARLQHPKLKARLHLGYFSSPEEAALVVKKKRDEFRKSEDGLSVTCCRDGFGGRKPEKLASGVRREFGRFRVRIWHPELKKYASFGSYSTCEEAALVADRKRAELQEMLQETERDFAGVSECSDEETSDAMVPSGVRRIKSGKGVARIKDPESSGRIWLGTYDTAEEAVRSYNKEKTVKIEPETSNSEFVGDKKACGLDFDEAVSVGIINEYGQLVGKYCELDEPMGLSLPDENIAATE